MSRGRRILAWTTASLVLLLAALVVFVATFDWNRIKPTLNARVSETLGRPFAINGDLSVRWQREPEEEGLRAWVPWPHVKAEDLTLGNPEWAKEQQFVTLARVEASLSPLPLLWKTVTIPRIDLTEPRADLKRRADGSNNWTFDKLASTPEQADEKPSAWTLDIGAIGFDKGQVKVDDQPTQTRLEVLVDPLGKPIPFSDIVGEKVAGKAAEQGDAPQDYAFGWKVKGSYKGQALDGSGKIGGLLALQDARKPFPLQADLRIGATRIALAGTLTDPTHLGALDLRLKLAGNSLGNLYPLTGVTLPDTPAYSTDGRLVAQLQDPAGPQFHYQGFNGAIGDSDIHGDLHFVARQPRPKLSGALTSNQLRFADLAPLIGADSNAEKKERGVASKQPADKVLPVEEFRTERWRQMDADVRFTGKRIVHSDKLPFNDLDTHVVLNDGKLSLEPLRFGMAGGSLDSTIRLDGSSVPLQGSARLSARHFKLKQLFPSFEPMRTSFGELNGDADLAGTGNSVAALLGSANGNLKLLINDGAVSRGLMEIAGLNVGNYLVGKLFGDDEVKINCAAADLKLTKGLVTPRVFIFDTENALIQIDGSANLASERLDMTVTPESKGVRIFSLRSPLYVRGTFKKPDAGVKAVPLIARGAGMVVLGAVVAPAAGLLALVAPSGGGDVTNTCTPLLEKMRKAN
ncbi:AsmA family protein [Pseudomonas sp. TUM22785]|uniref:AsmA family protein n=1 Tax=Pseudomonas sp. TUM22785 TaxID=3019098 RepID=UPI002304E449|nr:AsmA family protein [Pseudomonas sp. TUM22785]WCD79837.1 AsmA family protein [Pseudomonas sp. TUM22785]